MYTNKGDTEMKISKQQLIEMNICKTGLDRFIEQTGNTDHPVEVLSLIGGKNITSDLLWLAVRTLPREKLVRFACDVALINIEKIKPYTDKYDLIVEFLKNPTAAAYAAARAARAARAAAYAVARAARDAVYAARAADAADAADAAADATDAADAAAYAADAAAYAARDAARAAAAGARDAGATQEQINELIAKMFEGC